ncbi:SnoaL-like domain-containing protein [Nocardia veterana]|uniref:SnoaL-like domain-containing protein n=2 Tax=Nocardia veterana TaxID=132249 RepID=A0A7X6M0P9_9NOCA|nr:SnoaL-like domain-containing protein [Nocardia veterana]
MAERDIDRALAAYCRGIDRRDAELLRSVYHDDAIDDHGDSLGGAPDAYVEWVIGCRYIDRFENRPGPGWRISHRIVVREWRIRQPMLPEADQPPGFARSRRDRIDLSYLKRLPTRAEAAEAGSSAQWW